MIKHIVMFKLKEKSQENIEKAVSTLRGLEGNVETLRFIEVGTDFKASERSYDLVLTTHFDDEKGLLDYAQHPKHLPVLDTMKELTISSIVVDYVID